MISYKTITLRKGKEESLKRYHPWVFSGAIQRMDNGIEEGDIVNVTASDGSMLGVGHYQIGSIAVRMLDFSERVIDETFFVERLQRAFDMRMTLGLVRTERAISFPAWWWISTTTLPWCKLTLRGCTLPAISLPKHCSKLPADW